MILGFDPGRDKCGVAVMETNGNIVYHQVIASADAIATMNHLLHDYPIDRLVMGNQTTAKQWKQRLEREINSEIPIILVDERNSTVEARDRYWVMYPPKGLKRLIPEGMRLPPRPLDDIVAILLIERYLTLKQD